MISNRFLGDLIPLENDRKGLGNTMVLDRLAPIDWEILPDLASFISVVKIGWTLPLLLKRSTLVDRISRYRKSGVSVSPGGTLLEMAVNKGRADKALESIRDAGFDTVELSEGVIDVPPYIKKGIVDFAHSNGMRLNIEVGKKNPRNQLSLDETIQRVSESLDFGPDFVIIEGREAGRSVEIFDDLGDIKWDWVNRIIEEYPRNRIMFEAPIEKQQIELVIRLGSSVNLGNVSFNSVAALETQRRGLRGDTFGVVDNTVKVSGPPSNKFVYYIVANHGPIDQASMMDLTGMNRKTVQNALTELLENGLIKAATDRKDLRKRVYSINSGLQ
ncbi:hypothetical protein IX51_10350 [uncultured archaeon]|nr:hypothetical protein IX51_10350 [uncultured archaeon]